MSIASIEETTLDHPFMNARMDTYALLAILLNRPPGSDLLLQLQDAEWLPSMPQRLIAAWIKVRQAAFTCAPSAIEQEFQALFVGLGQGEVVPYASGYREGVLMGLPLARLRQDLAKIGIVRRPNVHEVEDHAGLLCETMALLASSPTLSLRTYARFFDEHVASWMFDFFSDVQKAPSARFYRVVAGMGSSLLRLEQNYLDAQRAAQVH